MATRELLNEAKLAWEIARGLGERRGNVDPGAEIPEKIVVRWKNLSRMTSMGTATGRMRLEVGGGTYAIRGELKKLGFWWDKDWGVWVIDSGSYHPNRGAGFDIDAYEKEVKKKNDRVIALKKKQDKAYPIVNALAKEHNDRVEQMVKVAQGERESTKEFIKFMDSHRRLVARLKEVYGIEIKHEFPGPWGSIGDFRGVRITGNTYDIRDLMKKYKFRWNSGLKAWEMADLSWRVKGDKWAREVAKTLAMQEGFDPDGSILDECMALLEGREMDWGFDTTWFSSPADWVKVLDRVGIDKIVPSGNRRDGYKWVGAGLSITTWYDPTDNDGLAGYIGVTGQPHKVKAFVNAVRAHAEGIKDESPRKRDFI